MQLISTVSDMSDEAMEKALSARPNLPQSLLTVGYLQFLHSKGLPHIPQWMISTVLSAHDATDLPLPENLYEARQMACHLHNFVLSYSDMFTALINTDEHVATVQ